MTNKLETKKRIRSIQSIRKTTNAMRLVSSAKIKRMRDTYERTKEYALTIEEMLRKIMSQSESDIQWFTPQSDNELVFVLASDMGLAAGYNSNLYRLVKEQLASDVELIVIGKKTRSLLKNANFNMNEEIISSDQFDYHDISHLMEEALYRFQQGEIGKISIVYTKFVNAMTFDATYQVLLPLNLEQDNVSSVYTEYEPSEKEIMSRLVPQYLKSVMYNLFYEAKTSEQSSRRLAMEQATDNADELIEDLQLKYNQARQAAITQEITEIVAAGEK